jgi:hypothetical protein
MKGMRGNEKRISKSEHRAQRRMKNPAPCAIFPSMLNVGRSMFNVLRWLSPYPSKLQALRFRKLSYTPEMNTLETDIEIRADGSVKLLVPLPAWLRPGRARILMTVASVQAQDLPQRQKLTATPEMIARREAALEEIRRLNPYRDITDPVAWQREIREDSLLPGRD